MNNRFAARKQQILKQLEAPEGEYHDLSPKGSMDEPIRELIDEINGLDGLVTTSSCSGRISVFLEGRKSVEELENVDGNEEVRAGPGGKGGGGAWLYISHVPMDRADKHSAPSISKTFGINELKAGERGQSAVDSRFIHLKFEPMILHILTASTEHAHRTLTAALSAGFRESGAVSLSATKSGESTPMVAIRSTGYSFDSIIGYQDSHGQNIALVDENYLKILIDIANDRFRINAERIARFRSALPTAYRPSNNTSIPSNKPGWEDAEVRKQRKREEGLARQQALQAQRTAEGTATEPESTIDGLDMMNA